MTHTVDPPHVRDTTPAASSLDGIIFEPTHSGSLSGKSLVLDPGHGGHDSGATHDGDTEKSITLAVSLMLKDILTGKGLRVIMTRADDTFIPLPDRAGMSNRYKPDLFQSVHVNDADNTSATGVETWYYADSCIPYATSILDALVEGTRDTRRKVNHGNLAVLRPNTRICCLAEIGFLSNPESHKKLMTDSYRGQIAQSIANGIENYLLGAAVRTTSASLAVRMRNWLSRFLCRLFGC
jgi:N-acetylmuramoyl-L-alanine amidase